MNKYYMEIGVFIICVIIMTGCSIAPAQTTRDDVIKVRTAPVEEKTLARPIRTSGKLSSKAELKLSFKIGGIVRSVYVDEGQVVSKGQKLAKLDLQEIKAQVNQARTVYEKAQRDLERVKSLFDDDAVTLENYQDAQTGLDIARANLKVAEFNLQHSTITAPSNGKIMRRFVEPNELAGPGVPIFLFGSSDKEWVVRVGLSDRDIVRVQLDDPARIEFDAYPEHQFNARVSEIAETDDPRTGLFEVELSLEASEYKIVSGFVARVIIIPQRVDTYVIIPVEALIEAIGNDGYVYVYDAENDKARKQRITIDHLHENQVALMTGLEPGMTVITQGAQYLIDGSQVQVIESDTRSKSQSPAPATDDVTP